MDEAKKKRKLTKGKKWLIGIGAVLLALVLAAGAFLLFGQQLMMGKPGGGEPWVDSDLKANIQKDMPLSLKDDFHLYVNHDWLLNHNIAPGRGSINSFTEEA